MSIDSRVLRGITYGAIGDGIGYPLEFDTPEMMPHPLVIPETLKVSDDTQMTIALAEAISHWQPANDRRLIGLLWKSIIRKYVTWAFSDMNDREPGHTCMGSLSRLSDVMAHSSDQEDFAVESMIHDTVLESTGSGAVMRVIPALSVPAEYRYAVAWSQSLVTHHDPRAVAAAMMVVNAGEHLMTSGEYDLSRTVNFLDEMSRPGTFIFTRIPSGDWEKSLSVASTGQKYDPEESLVIFLNDASEPDDNGLTLSTVIDRAQKYVEETDIMDLLDPRVDVADVIGGEGWDSVSAVGIALLGVHLVTSTGLDVMSVLEWLVTTTGDSDTVGTIFGHLIGVGRTDDAMEQLVPTIEPYYLDKIQRLF